MNTQNRTIFCFSNAAAFVVKATLIASVATLVACGSTPVEQPVAPVEDAAYEVSEDYIDGVIRYTVQRGDRLGDIALEFTGSAANWRDIAGHNSITNPRRLAVGSVLEIPTDLIPGYQTSRVTPSNQQFSQSANQSVSQPTYPSSDQSGADIITPGNTLAVKSQPVVPDVVAPVVVTPIEDNRNFELNPIDPSVAQGPINYDSGSRQIKVVGSYYPKGIYSEPAAYSKLMMRVAPGSEFALQQQVNDWYKIITNQGTGYIRVSDAELLN